MERAMLEWPHAMILNHLKWELDHLSQWSEGFRFTHVLSNLHPDIVELADCESEERILVTVRTSESHWYALTTRRVTGACRGMRFDVATERVSDVYFGVHEKQDVVPIRQGAIEFDGRSRAFEFETGRAYWASGAYADWWSRKYPILHNLEFDPAANLKP